MTNIRNLELSLKLDRNLSLTYKQRELLRLQQEAEERRRLRSLLARNRRGRYIQWTNRQPFMASNMEIPPEEQPDHPSSQEEININPDEDVDSGMEYPEQGQSEENQAHLQETVEENVPYQNEEDGYDSEVEALMSTEDKEHPSQQQSVTFSPPTFTVKPPSGVQQPIATHSTDTIIKGKFDLTPAGWLHSTSGRIIPSAMVDSNGNLQHPSVGGHHPMPREASQNLSTVPFTQDQLQQVFQKYRDENPTEEITQPDFMESQSPAQTPSLNPPALKPVDLISRLKARLTDQSPKASKRKISDTILITKEAVKPKRPLPAPGGKMGPPPTPSPTKPRGKSIWTEDLEQEKNPKDIKEPSYSLDQTKQLGNLWSNTAINKETSVSHKEEKDPTGSGRDKISRGRPHHPEISSVGHTPHPRHGQYNPTLPPPSGSSQLGNPEEIPKVPLKERIMTIENKQMLMLKLLDEYSTEHLPFDLPKAYNRLEDERQRLLEEDALPNIDISLFESDTPIKNYLTSHKRRHQPSLPEKEHHQTASTVVASIEPPPKVGVYRRHTAEELTDLITKGAELGHCHLHGIFEIQCQENCSTPPVGRKRESMIHHTVTPEVPGTSTSGQTVNQPRLTGKRFHRPWANLESYQTQTQPGQQVPPDQTLVHQQMTYRIQTHLPDNYGHTMSHNTPPGQQASCSLGKVAKHAHYTSPQQLLTSTEALQAPITAPPRYDLPNIPKTRPFQTLKPEQFPDGKLPPVTEPLLTSPNLFIPFFQTRPFPSYDHQGRLRETETQFKQRTEKEKRIYDLQIQAQWDAYNFQQDLIIAHKKQKEQEENEKDHQQWIAYVQNQGEWYKYYTQRASEVRDLRLRDYPYEDLSNPFYRNLLIEEDHLKQLIQDSERNYQNPPRNFSRDLIPPPIFVSQFQSSSPNLPANSVPRNQPSSTERSNRNESRNETITGNRTSQTQTGSPKSTGSLQSPEQTRAALSSPREDCCYLTESSAESNDWSGNETIPSVPKTSPLSPHDNYSNGNRSNRTNYEKKREERDNSDSPSQSETSVSGTDHNEEQMNLEGPCCYNRKGALVCRQNHPHPSRSAPRIRSQSQFRDINLVSNCPMRSAVNTGSDDSRKTDSSSPPEHFELSTRDFRKSISSTPKIRSTSRNRDRSSSRTRKSPRGTPRSVSPKEMENVQDNLFARLHRLEQEILASKPNPMPLLTPKNFLSQTPKEKQRFSGKEQSSCEHGDSPYPRPSRKTLPNSASSRFSTPPSRKSSLSKGNSTTSSEPPITQEQLEDLIIQNQVFQDQLEVLQEQFLSAQSRPSSARTSPDRYSVHFQTPKEKRTHSNSEGRKWTGPRHKNGPQGPNSQDKGNPGSPGFPRNSRYNSTGTDQRHFDQNFPEPPNPGGYHNRGNERSKEDPRGHSGSHDNGSGRKTPQGRSPSNGQGPYHTPPERPSSTRGRDSDRERKSTSTHNAEENRDDSKRHSHRKRDSPSPSDSSSSSRDSTPEGRKGRDKKKNSERTYFKDSSGSKNSDSSERRKHSPECRRKTRKEERKKKSSSSERRERNSSSSPESVRRDEKSESVLDLLHLLKEISPPKRDTRDRNQKSNRIGLFFKYAGQEPRFSGERAGALEHLREFTHQAASADLTPSETFAMFRHRLSKSAIVWFDQAFPGDSKDPRTEEEVEDLGIRFLMRFEGTSLRAAALSKLTSRRHNPHETYMAYYDDILHWCKQADPDMNDATKSHHLENGLSLSDIQRLNDRYSNPTVKQIGEQLMRWDSGARKANTIFKGRNPPTILPLKTEPVTKVTETTKKTTAYPPVREWVNYRGVSSANTEGRPTTSTSKEGTAEERLAKTLAQLIRNTKTSDTPTPPRASRSNVPYSRDEATRSTSRTQNVNLVDWEDPYEVNLAEWESTSALQEPEPELEPYNPSLDNWEGEEDENPGDHEVLLSVKDYKDKPGRPVLGSRNTMAREPPPASNNILNSGQNLKNSGQNINRTGTQNQVDKLYPDHRQAQKPPDTRTQGPPRNNPNPPKEIEYRKPPSEQNKIPGPDLNNLLSQIKDLCAKVQNSNVSTPRNSMTDAVQMNLCFNCHQPDHYRSQCPHPIRTSRATSPAPQGQTRTPTLNNSLNSSSTQSGNGLTPRL